MIIWGNWGVNVPRAKVNYLGFSTLEAPCNTRRGMSDSTQPNEVTREVRFEHSRDFVGILQQAGVSLLVSTYQAGKLAVIGTDSNGLLLSLHNFDKAMGVAVHSRQIAVGAGTQIWLLRSAPPVVAQMGPKSLHDACYLTRSSHVTEEIHVHEMAWCHDELWFANTRFSCLCTLHENFGFVPRWKPAFISELRPEDRCHLNGLCMEDNLPKYVTVLAQTDTPAGWRPTKATAGCLIDVASGETVASGFAMPHSPRVYRDRVWVLDSGTGRMVTVEPSTGRFDPVTQQPGYTRGLDFAGPLAFIGLSRIRETSTFGGVPIAENRDQLKCAVAVVDLRTGRRVAYFEFLTGVEEIFDVRVLHGIRNPYVSGPLALAEGAKTVWYAPSSPSITSQLKSTSGSSADVEHQGIGAPANPPVPDEALELFDRGNRLSAQDRFAQAAECFENALGICPAFAEAHCNLGLALQFLGRSDESIDRLQQSLSLAPKTPVTHINLATSLFLKGRLGRAWHEYEWRWKCARFDKRPIAATRIAPPWDGSSLAGRTILVYGEQGIGDEIMFASCLADLVDEAARCILACEPRLMPLIRRSFPEVHVLSMEDLRRSDHECNFGQIDFQIAAGSLPRVLRPSLDHFPSQPSYLVADPSFVEQARGRLASYGVGKYVGISWKGGGEEAERRRRSTNLEQWGSVFDVPDVHFVSLQYGDCTDELNQVKQRSGVTVHDWLDVDPLDNMDRFAAQVAAVDCVISIDNSTIHLAGALGVPTLAMLSFPSASYWRWFWEGEETVWYPSLRLFRRRYPDDWEPTFREVRARLCELTQS